MNNLNEYIVVNGVVTKLEYILTGEYDTIGEYENDINE